MQFAVTLILLLLCLPIYGNEDLGPQALIVKNRLSSDDDGDTNDLVDDRFANWEKQYQQGFIDSESIESSVCPIQGQPLDLMQVKLFGMRSCKPDENDRSLLYDGPLSTEQQRQRDDLICKCFSDGNTFEAHMGNASPEEKRHRETDWKKWARKLSDAEYAEKRFGEGFGPALTSMNFGEGKKDSEALAGVYLQWNKDMRDRDVKVLNDVLTPDNLNDQICVPPREFIFHEQFPEEASFYEDLSKPFRPDDWDYSKLAKSLSRYNRLAEAELVPEVESIIVRMKFLLHNPAYKAMFMSSEPGSAPHKAELYKMLQDNLPKPECGEVLCHRTDDWENKLQNYKAHARNFLSTGKVITDIQTGIKDGQKLDWWKKNKNTSEVLNNPIRASWREWKDFCVFRNTEEAESAVNPLLSLIESRYGINFADVSSNSEYQKINKVYCQIPRRSPNGGTMLYKDFRQSNCSNKRPRECLAKFVQNYPYSTDKGIGLIFDINSILEKSDTLAEVAADSTLNITTISRDSGARSRSIHYLEELPSQFSAHGPGEAVASAGKALATQNATAAPILNQPVLNQPQMFVPDTVFQPQMANAVSAPQKMETLRENLSQGETQAQMIRNEISSLRNSLNESPVTKGAGAENFTGLSDRLASLERRLSDKEKENSELRDQMAESLKPVSLQAPRNMRTLEDLQDQQNSSGGVSTLVNVPQGGNSGGGFSAPLSSAGASLFSPGFGSVSRSVTASGSALLSKYGIQGTQLENGIIVASSNEKVNFEMLRTQSGKNILPLTLTVEEFNQLSQSDESALAKYLPQVEAVPGEVVRLEIKTSDNRSMEVYVVKNGSEMAIFRTPQAARGIASEGKAQASTDREFTLDNLRNELSN
jgi:hypothetical protein